MVQREGSDRFIEMNDGELAYATPECKLSPVKDSSSTPRLPMRLHMAIFSTLPSRAATI